MSHLVGHDVAEQLRRFEAEEPGQIVNAVIEEPGESSACFLRSRREAEDISISVLLTERGRGDLDNEGRRRRFLSGEPHQCGTGSIPAVHPETGNPVEKGQLDG
jgi:hypothetical protein